ncbi:prepilin-type N-terminal cleavage/methylation domain-containing protein [Natroniella sulfidigena]|uniref:PilW family protein n=1 Tax=Natroniella sulfidigena TaxID=723921 RepID=UPI002009F145|nr:prepilin-type N-terminal cleavage/methylation domain-containing protein [Natroniella sulfidigena]MCK8816850.1 prepilin-type N-terminal cleavage/methylation domain-containing protein [Natroniella sulfidigena]
MQNFHKEEAVTLIELLIVIAIIGVVFTAIYNTHLTGWRVWSFSQDRVELQQAARLIMMQIGRDARRAKPAENGIGGGFQLNLVYEGQEIQYKVIKDDDSSLGKLTRTINDETSRSLTAEIIDMDAYNDSQFFDIDKIDEGLVVINLKLKQGNQKYELQNTVYLRN